jgi:uncharacterized membrane protein
MEINELYSFVLMLVLIGFVLGVGILALDKFSSSSGVTATAGTAINNTRAEIAKIPSDWLGLIVTIVVLAIIFTIVVRSFSAGRGR